VTAFSLALSATATILPITLLVVGMAVVVAVVASTCVATAARLPTTPLIAPIWVAAVALVLVATIAPIPNHLHFFLLLLDLLFTLLVALTPSLSNRLNAHPILWHGQPKGGKQRLCYRRLAEAAECFLHRLDRHEGEGPDTRVQHASKVVILVIREEFLNNGCAAERESASSHPRSRKQAVAGTRGCVWRTPKEKLFEL
jgi:hypothetical protein